MRSRLRGVCIAGSFAVLSLALVGASCDKKTVASPSPEGKVDGPSVPFENGAAKPAETGSSAAASVPAASPPKPAERPKLTDPKPLDDAQKGRFEAVAAKLQSPCGGAQSLAKALGDAACKRSPFAKRYVEWLVKMDLSEDEIKEIYLKRFDTAERHAFNLGDTPFSGPQGAPVQIVEFFDYACPHCRVTLPVLEEVGSNFPSDVVIYYKHFPVHQQAPMVAKGAIAAQRQGRFLEMHRKLFANQENQTREDIFAYAKDLGLDMAKFQADFDDPASAVKVSADRDDGIKAGVKATPSMFINGKQYLGPTLTPEEISDWVAEELAAGHENGH